MDQIPSGGLLQFAIISTVSLAYWENFAANGFDPTRHTLFPSERRGETLSRLVLTAIVVSDSWSSAISPRASESSRYVLFDSGADAIMGVTTP